MGQFVLDLCFLWSSTVLPLSAKRVIEQNCTCAVFMETSMHESFQLLRLFIFVAATNYPSN
jgi:hypothetical protein